jgi:hypothetical protein
LEFGDGGTLHQNKPQVVWRKFTLVENGGEVDHFVESCEEGGARCAKFSEMCAILEICSIAEMQSIACSSSDKQGVNLGVIKER